MDGKHGNPEGGHLVSRRKVIAALGAMGVTAVAGGLGLNGWGGSAVAAAAGEEGDCELCALAVAYGVDRAQLQYWAASLPAANGDYFAYNNNGVLEMWRAQGSTTLGGSPNVTANMERVVQVSVGISSTEAGIVASLVQNRAAKVASQIVQIQNPIKLPSLSTLSGESAGIAFIGTKSNVKHAIKKTTNNAVTITNYETGETATIDCLLYIDPFWIDGIVFPEGHFPQKVILEKLALQGAGPTVGQYGLYIEQGGVVSVRDVDIIGFEHAVYTKDGWLSVYERVHAFGKFTIRNGTSHTFNNCWTGGNGGFDFNGVKYSVMNGCASDHSTNTAYRFAYSYFTLNGCGCEGSSTSVSDSGTALAFDGNNIITLNNFNIVSFSTDVIPLISVGANDTITFNGGKFDFTQTNAPDLFVHGSGSTVVFNDTVFQNGTRHQPLIQFKPGVQNSKVIVRFGDNERIYSPASSGTAPLVDAMKDNGTFMPGLEFGGQQTGITYSSRSGYWYKLGNTIHMYGTIELSSLGTATGPALISGFPVIPKHKAALNFLYSSQAPGQLIGIFDQVEYARLYVRGTPSDVLATHSDFSSTSILHFEASFVLL
ncbi:hypothetical protein [Paenibacillus sp. GCM10027626]|uniref:hypothetical protein n=1 Tax=Paenibacillus sp. GCM10027626 TaxID=3273411 RepID=UPI0036409800